MLPPAKLAKSDALPTGSGAAYGITSERVDLVVWSSGREVKSADLQATWTRRLTPILPIMGAGLHAAECEALASEMSRSPLAAGAVARQIAGLRSRWAAAAARDARRPRPPSPYLVEFFAERAASSPLRAGDAVAGRWEALPIGSVVDSKDGSALPLLIRGADGWRWTRADSAARYGRRETSLERFSRAVLVAVLPRVPRGSAELLMGLASQDYEPAVLAVRKAGPPACRAREMGSM